MAGLWFLATKVKTPPKLIVLLIAAAFAHTITPLSAIKIVVPEQYKDQIEAIKAAERAEREKELQGVNESADAAMSIDAPEGQTEDNQSPEVAADEFLVQSVIEATDSATEFELNLAASEGIISGQIIDKENGQPLSGVAILLEDTNIATVTDSKGRYSLGPAPAGEYTVSFVKTGYIEANVTDYAIVGGEVSVFPFGLPPRPADMSDEVYELQDFTVTAEQANQLMMNLDLVMGSENLLSIMSTEDFSKFAASDIGAAVKRVSGVTVEGGKYAVIRGLGDRYVSTTLNGIPIASPDPDRLAVQLDLFPTSLVSSLEVTKTYTPDQPGNSTGGINIVAGSIPEDFFLEFSISGGFNSESYGNNGFLQNGASTSGDRWARGASKRSLAGSLQGPYPDINDLGKTINDTFAPIIPSIFISQADYDAILAELNALRSILGQNNHNFEEKPEPNHGVKFSFGDAFDIDDGIRFGYQVGINYSRKSEFKDEAEYFRSSIDPGSPVNFSSNNFQNPSAAIGYHKALLSEALVTSVLSGSGSVGLELGDMHKLNLTVLDLNVSEDLAVRLDATGRNGNFGRYYQFPFRDLWDPTFDEAVARTDYQMQESLNYTERSLTVWQASGSHEFEIPDAPLGRFLGEWAVSRDRAIQDEPGFLQTRGIEANLAGDYTLSTNSTSSASVEPSYVIWRKVDDEKETQKADISFFGEQRDGWKTILKAGILKSGSDRSVFDEFLELVALEEEIPASSDVDGAPFQNYDNLYPTAYNVAADVSLETVSKGYYFMVDQEFFDCLRIIAGARFESNSADVSVNGTPILRGAGFNNPFIGLDNTSGGYDTDSKLPSVTGMLTLLDDRLTIRAAYSETLALPSAREVSPYASSTFSGADVEVGNLALIPSEVTNYDAGFTYRTDGGDYITLNYFEKEVSDRIERIAGLGADSSDSADYADYDIFAYSQNVGAGIFSWYNNPSEAELWGVEFEARKTLDFVGLENFSLGFNYTYIEGTVDRFPVEVAGKTLSGVLPPPDSGQNSNSTREGYRVRQLTGQPSDIFSGDITYENPDWGFRISLIGYYVSDILEGTSLADSYDVFTKGYSAFDLTLSKQISENLKFGTSIKNLTDSARGTYYQTVQETANGLSFGEVDRDSYRVGRSFSFSLSYSY